MATCNLSGSAGHQIELSAKGKGKKAKLLRKQDMGVMVMVYRLYTVDRTYEYQTYPRKGFLRISPCIDARWPHASQTGPSC